MTNAAPSPKRRLRRWLFRGLFSFAVLLATLAASFLWSRSRAAAAGREHLDLVLAVIDEVDPRWRWEQIDQDRPAVTDAENSVRRILEVVAAMARWEPKDLETADGRYVLEREAPNLRLDNEQMGRLLRALMMQEQALVLAGTLRDLPRGRADIRLAPEVITTLLPHLQPSRQVVQLLMLDCERLLIVGRADQAVERVRALLHAAAAPRGEPFLISQLVRVANRTLAARRVERILGMAELNDETCRRLMTHLEAELRDNLILTATRGERAAWHALFENFESGRLSLDAFHTKVSDGAKTDSDWLSRGGWWLYAAHLQEDHANFLLWLHRQCEIAALPQHEQVAAWQEFDAEFRAFATEARSRRRNILTALMMPATMKVAEGAMRDRASMTCHYVALAVERFRLANKRWPNALDELRPKFLKEVPPDSYTGEPLVYAAREDGVVIYSVGADLSDDGGMLELSGKPGTDLGVRLFNPDRRGLEPLKMPTSEE